MFFLPFLMVRSIASPKKIKFSNSKSASFSFQFCDMKLRLENLPPKNRKLLKFTLEKSNLPKNLGYKMTKKEASKKEKKKRESPAKSPTEFFPPEIMVPQTSSLGYLDPPSLNSPSLDLAPKMFFLKLK